MGMTTVPALQACAVFKELTRGRYLANDDDDDDDKDGIPWANYVRPSFKYFASINPFDLSSHPVSYILY